MSKTKKPPKSRDAYPKLPIQASPPPHHGSHAFRETLESIVIAFVLAFLFRTFEAEAFVIPTGSMAPTLMGAHKDVDCLKCGHRFRVNSSEEDAENVLGMAIASPHDSCLAGMCPVCRYVNPMRPGLRIDALEREDAGKVTKQKRYNGDRILVNKYVYTVSDPERWDVVVFKFPGNAQMNYIKRLVGLPGETVRVFQGDLFIAPNNGSNDAELTIARKPAEKLLAMRQLVHDTDYDPAELYAAGWPLRWQAQTGPDGGAGGWQVEAQADGLTVRQRFEVDAPAGETAWLRYRHLAPSYDDWRQVEAFTQAANKPPAAAQAIRRSAGPQLVTDFNAYNTRVSQVSIDHWGDLRVDPAKLGLHWVGDLMVEADVEVKDARGELLVDLVEAGRHFTATFDLATGRVVLGAEGIEGFAPVADTPLNKPGTYHVALANFDDQLVLWVDDKIASFEGTTNYDAAKIFGSRAKIIPQTSDADPGDFAPVGIGARDTKLAVTRLQVWRDIYYVADSWQRTRVLDGVVTDFGHPFDPTLLNLPFDPALWPRFVERQMVEFPLGKDQFFVMGDNSPESSDARLWLSQARPSSGRPGGAYLERQLLIGKALCVYWPHSWDHVPGTPVPFPLFPNVEDMRLVR